MVSIKTESLREQAEELNRTALQYDHRFAVLEECSSWLRRQEYDETNSIYRVLVREQEKMQQQKRELLLLAEGLRRISDRYDRTEERIMENEEMFTKTPQNIQWMDVGGLRDRLSELMKNMVE